MNRKIKRLTQLGLYTLVLMSAACQNQENQENQEVAEIVSSEKQSHVISKKDMGAATGDISMDQQIQDAIADLANRLGVAVDAITVKEARALQWGSGAMGCPKPGMNYTQALVPGVRLLLEADGTIYYYHGSRRGSLFQCPAKLARAPAYGQGLEVM